MLRARARPLGSRRDGVRCSLAGGCLLGESAGSLCVTAAAGQAVTAAGPEPCPARGWLFLTGIPGGRERDGKNLAGPVNLSSKIRRGWRGRKGSVSDRITFGKAKVTFLKTPFSLCYSELLQEQPTETKMFSCFGTCKAESKHSVLQRDYYDCLIVMVLEMLRVRLLGNRPGQPGQPGVRGPQ